MKRIRKYIHKKLNESMLKDENFIPIYRGDDLIEFIYRKVEE